MLSSSLQRGIDIIKEAVKNMPISAGVYKMITTNSDILYIGKAKCLPKRVISYSKTDNLPNRLQRMVSQLERIEYLTTTTEAEALLLEAHLIRSVKPKFNIALKDDKSFPYIVIEDDHEYPRIAKFRGVKRPNQSYFGPFAQARNVNYTIIELQKLFLIRPCTNSFFSSRKRPCLQYQIKRCSGPCTAKISIPEYKKLISQTKDFLNGRNSNVQEKLISDMNMASDKLEYEKAGVLRDRIKLLTQIQAKNILKIDSIQDADIIAIYKDHTGTAIQVMFIRNSQNYGNKAYFPAHTENLSEGEILELFIGQLYQKNIPSDDVLVSHNLPSKKILEQALKRLAGKKITITNPTSSELKHLLEFAVNNAKEVLAKTMRERSKKIAVFEKIGELFGLTKTPERIEVFDNSHISGTNAVGCMIVASPEGFLKNQYRKYTIKEITDIGDDYQMLREVLTRRLKRLSPQNYPDLMLIDGGKGHLTIANEVLDSLDLPNINLVCISKGRDRNAGREFFHLKSEKSFQLPVNDSTLHYLQYMRDEVHRFAITTHRNKRLKSTLKSSIEDIPGVGKIRKIQLLTHFGSRERLKEASIEDIARIKGFNKKIAKTIHDYLHDDSN